MPSSNGGGSHHGQNPSYFYKTKLCIAFASPKGCASGAACGYAHGPDQLKIATVPSYKTKPCQRMLKEGFCVYGVRCVFLHPEEFKKKDCERLMATGYCSYGETCVFRHPGDPVDVDFNVAAFSAPPSTSSGSVRSSGTPTVGYWAGVPFGNVRGRGQLEAATIPSHKTKPYVYYGYSDDEDVAFDLATTPDHSSGSVFSSGTPTTGRWSISPVPDFFRSYSASPSSQKSSMSNSSMWNYEVLSDIVWSVVEFVLRDD